MKQNGAHLIALWVVAEAGLDLRSEGADLDGSADRYAEGDTECADGIQQSSCLGLTNSQQSPVHPDQDLTMLLLSTAEMRATAGESALTVSGECWLTELAAEEDRVAK